MRRKNIMAACAIAMAFLSILFWPIDKTGSLKYDYIKTDFKWIIDEHGQANQINACISSTRNVENEDVVMDCYKVISLIFKKESKTRITAICGDYSCTEGALLVKRESVDQ